MMDQFNLFQEPKDFRETIQIQNGEYIYIPNFYNKELSDSFFKSFIIINSFFIKIP